MKYLNPEKLFVSFRPEATPTGPIFPRRYTLTHSDITGDLFLVIGSQYAYDKLNAMRDEVLGEWKTENGKDRLEINLLVDGKFGTETAYLRNQIFRRELPLAIEAIRYGDREFFDVHQSLDYAPIYVKFNSSIPELNRTEYWGTLSQYK
ncbi:MAG: staygreen family protein [Ignavibacteriales bacterium]